MSVDEQQWKDGSDRYAQYYGDVRRLLATEYASGVRWITASLFALNAGGLVSLASKAKLSSMQQNAGYAFWLGVLMAFVYVIYSQAKTKQFLHVIQKIENCWVIGAATGNIDHEQLEELERQKTEANSRFAGALSVGSFVMFSVGMGFFAYLK